MVIKHLFINNNNLTLIKLLFIKSNLHNNFYYYANIMRYKTELYIKKQNELIQQIINFLKLDNENSY